MTILFLHWHRSLLEIDFFLLAMEVLLLTAIDIPRPKVCWGAFAEILHNSPSDAGFDYT